MSPSSPEKISGGDVGVGKGDTGSDSELAAVAGTQHGKYGAMAGLWCKSGMGKV
jgi:hypothetical protein